MTTTTERTAHIAAIREREQALPPPPWRECGHDDRDGCECGLVWCLDIDAVVAAVPMHDPDGTWAPGMRIAIARFIANARQDIPWLLDELARLEAVLEERQDWTGDDVHDAVTRVRDASQSRGPVASVAVLDLRKLFASADGVADSYSRLLEHTTGLTKPTTDPTVAITLADGRENERFRECLKDELAALATDGSPR